MGTRSPRAVQAPMTGRHAPTLAWVEGRQPRRVTGRTRSRTRVTPEPHHAALTWSGRPGAAQTRLAPRSAPPAPAASSAHAAAHSPLARAAYHGPSTRPNAPTTLGRGRPTLPHSSHSPFASSPCGACAARQHSDGATPSHSGSGRLPPARASAPRQGRASTLPPHQRLPREPLRVSEHNAHKPPNDPPNDASAYPPLDQQPEARKHRASNRMQPP